MLPEIWACVPTTILCDVWPSSYDVDIVTVNCLPGGLVVRIRRSHRRGRGSIPRLGRTHFSIKNRGATQFASFTVAGMLGGYISDQLQQLIN